MKFFSRIFAVGFAIATIFQVVAMAETNFEKLSPYMLQSATGLAFFDSKSFSDSEMIQQLKKRPKLASLLTADKLELPESALLAFTADMERQPLIVFSLKGVTTFKELANIITKIAKNNVMSEGKIGEYDALIVNNTGYIISIAPGIFLLADSTDITTYITAEKGTNATLAARIAPITSKNIFGSFEINDDEIKQINFFGEFINSDSFLLSINCLMTDELAAKQSVEEMNGMITMMGMMFMQKDPAFATKAIQAVKFSSERDTVNMLLTLDSELIGTLYEFSMQEDARL